MRRGFLEAGAKFFGGLSQKITHFGKFFENECNNSGGWVHLVIVELFAVKIRRMCGAYDGIIYCNFFERRKKWYGRKV